MIPGNAAAVAPDRPFSALHKFGSDFLAKVRGRERERERETMTNDDVGKESDIPTQWSPTRERLCPGVYARHEGCVR